MSVRSNQDGRRAVQAHLGHPLRYVGDVLVNPDHRYRRIADDAGSLMSLFIIKTVKPSWLIKSITAVAVPFMSNQPWGVASLPRRGV